MPSKKWSDLIVIFENLARQFVSVEDASHEVERSFAATARSEARNYPVVRELLGVNDAICGVISGRDTSAGVLGLKAGGF